jgi:hypothetical protein
VLAGSCWTIPSGSFYSFKCHTTCIVVVVRWLAPLGVVQALYNLGVWYEASDECARARAQLKYARLMLDYEWMEIFERSINMLYSDDMNQPFRIAPTRRGGVRSVSYGLTRSASPSMKDEMRKGGDMFLIGGVARMMGHGKVRIKDIDARWWGKLTTWCRGHFGLTTHQEERDRLRQSRPLPRLPQEGNIELGDSDSEVGSA